MKNMTPKQILQDLNDGVDFLKTAVRTNSRIHMYNIVDFCNVEIMTALEDGKIDVNECNFLGVSMLMYCMTRRNVKIITMLLEQGADVNAKDSFNCTALFYAKAVATKEIEDVLIKHGAVE